MLRAPDESNETGLCEVPLVEMTEETLTFRERLCRGEVTETMMRGARTGSWSMLSSSSRSHS